MVMLADLTAQGGPLKKKKKVDDVGLSTVGGAKAGEVSPAGGTSPSLATIGLQPAAESDATKRKRENKTILEGLGLDTVLTPLKKKKKATELTDTLGG